jgi:hypothetical protein
VKLNRLSAGHYLATVRGDTYQVWQDEKSWRVQHADTGKDVNKPQKTKKAAVELLERIERSGRITVKELKIPRRPEITPGTELHVEGLHGRVTFLGYTKVTNGTAKDYVEVLVAGGRSRLVDPSKITKVHRTKKPVR